MVTGDDADIAAALEIGKLYVVCVSKLAVGSQRLDKVFFADVTLSHRVPLDFAIANEHTAVSFDDATEAIGTKGDGSEDPVQADEHKAGDKGWKKGGRTVDRPAPSPE